MHVSANCCAWNFSSQTRLFANKFYAVYFAATAANNKSKYMHAAIKTIITNLEDTTKEEFKNISAHIENATENEAYNIHSNYFQRRTEFITNR